MVNESVFASPHGRKLEQAISVAGARDHAREALWAGGASGGLAGLGFELWRSDPADPSREKNLLRQKYYGQF